MSDTLTVIGDDRDRIPKRDLIMGLRGLPRSPWRTYEGTGLTEISLAALLKIFDVTPKTIRIRPRSELNSTAKGYLRLDLEVAVLVPRGASDEGDWGTSAGDKSQHEADNLSNIDHDVSATAPGISRWEENRFRETGLSNLLLEHGPGRLPVDGGRGPNPWEE